MVVRNYLTQHTMAACMRCLAERLFPQIKDQEISWERDDVAFEFLTLACLVSVARENDWIVELPILPPSFKRDSWCSFPRHSFSRFGKSTRRATIEELIAALTPRVVLRRDDDSTLIYYQGFPPMDNEMDRPDWLFIKGGIQIASNSNQVDVELKNANKRILSASYGTLLNKFGPEVRKYDGVLPDIRGIIEVSLSKTAKHLEAQLERYSQRYNCSQVVAVLGSCIESDKCPCVFIDPIALKEERLRAVGKVIYKLLLP